MKFSLPVLVLFSFFLVGSDACGQGKGAVLQGKVALRPSESRPGGSHHYLSRYTDGGAGRLAAAVDSLGTEKAVLLLDIDDVLGDNVIVPETIRLIHYGAALIDLSGRDLEIGGGLAAQKGQVFTGAGKVVFAPGSMERILPQWWGGNTSGSVQAALTAAVNCGAELYLPKGDYIFTETVWHEFAHTGLDIKSLTITGAGPGHTIIYNQTAGDPALRIGTVNTPTDWAWFVTIGGLEITTSGAGGNGIEVADTWNGRIHNCYIHDLGGDGIFMKSGELADVCLCKTWNIERSVIFGNGGYGIHLEGTSYEEVSYNIVIDQLDVECNDAGGIYAAVERAQITNSIFAYNGADSTSHGGIHVTGVLGHWVHNNIIAGNGFEANFPYDIYVDRAVDISIEQNGFARIEFQGSVQPDYFIVLGDPDSSLNSGAINVEVKLNKFRSAYPASPFTAIKGSPELTSVVLDDNIFHIESTDRRFVFDPDTKVTYSDYGDTALTNQSIKFADPATGQADTYIDRGGPGIVRVTGGVAGSMQVVSSIGGLVVIDCAQGLNVLHTLAENTTVMPPANPVPGAILNMIVFQAYGTYTVGFDPIFKVAEPLTASSLHYSSIRFLYTGLYWIQLGGAAIDAPL